MVLLRHEMCPSILLIAVFVLLLAKGSRFPIAGNLELRGWNTQIL